MKSSKELIEKIHLFGVSKDYLNSILETIEKEKREEVERTKSNILELFNFEGNVGCLKTFITNKIKRII